MNMKTRYLTIGVLLMTLSLAAFQAPLQAQDTGDPAATEDPCTAILDAAMQSQDTAAPDATEDPALTACLDALDTMGTDTASATDQAPSDAQDTAMPDATDATDQVNQDTQATSEPIPTATRPPADTAAYHSITVMNRSTEFLGRFWLTWHVPGTGALVALGSGNILAGASATLPIPSGAFGIGIRVELYARGNGLTGGIFNPAWMTTNSCLFGFADAHTDRAISLDAVSTGLAIPVAPIVDTYGCTLDSGN